MKRYRRNAIRRAFHNGTKIEVRPRDRLYAMGEPGRRSAPRSGVCPGKNWPCDAGCGTPLVLEGLTRVTCPKAHFHRLCAACCAFRLSRLGVTLDTIEAGYLKRGMEIGPMIKLSRCPGTITEAELAMLALAEVGA